MKPVKKLFFLILFFSSLLGLFAKDKPPAPPPYPPPPPPPPEGMMKRGTGIVDDDSDLFKLIFIKTFTEENVRFVDFCFNKAVDPSSIDEAVICIDGEPVDKKNIMFSKDGHKFRVGVEVGKEEKHSILVEGLISGKGYVLPRTELDKLEDNSVYRLDKESGKWQKFWL